MNRNAMNEIWPAKVHMEMSLIGAVVERVVDQVMMPLLHLDDN